MTDQTEANAPVTITAQQALTMNVARQRDNAMNRVAELEVENAQLGQVNRDLGALCETLRKQLDEFKEKANGQPADGPVGTAQADHAGAGWNDGSAGPGSRGAPSGSVTG